MRIQILNLVLNVIALTYIITKEMGAIKKFINSVNESINEYCMAFKKQLIVMLAKNINAKVIFSDEPEDNVVAVELDNDTDMLLATCIAVGDDGSEVIVDYDFRGEDSTPLNFSMFGGYVEQHYDLNLIKSLGGEKRSTDHYYAFENTIYNAKKQGYIKDSYVLLLDIKLGIIKNAIKPNIIDEDWFEERDDTPIINDDSIIVDVADETYQEVAVTEEDKDPVIKDDMTLIMEEIEAGVLNKDFLEAMLKLHVDSIDKVFYTESK